MNENDTARNAHIRASILSPSPAFELEDLSKKIRPRPHYLGPGAWYNFIRKINRVKH